MRLRRWISRLTAACLLTGLLCGGAPPARAAETVHVSNVVVLVDFQDTHHETHSFLTGLCPEKDPESLIETMNGENPRSMARYLSNISYGRLQVTSLFPQYRDGTITAYRLEHDAAYYADGNMLGVGTKIITELLPRLREDLPRDGPDRNGDGVIDNLTMILPCDDNSRDSLFYSHKAVYAGMDTVNGLRIANYNVLTEYALSHNGSAVAIHEFLHTLGYPDLYDGTRNSSSGDTGAGASGSTGQPVGLWDIMSSTFLYVRYPLAYLRSAVTGWFDIPTVLDSRRGYSLYAASAATEETKDRQAVILRTDYSATEFFVLEYRRRGVDYSTTDYDCGIPGSGLIVYRVDLLRESNYAGPPYRVYVFRPGDRFADGRELAGGRLGESFLSEESGRTAYGSADPAASLAEGAITYSDGTNSGIVISNVGRAEGDTISFDITFPEKPEDGWELEGFAPVDAADCLASCVDGSGSLRQLLRKDGGVYLYQFSDGAWQRCSQALPADARCDFHLVTYDGSIYAAYKDSRRARLLRLSGSAWEQVYTSDRDITQLDVTADAFGIYLAYTSWDTDALFAVRYTAEGAMPLGAAPAQNTTVATPSIAAENGNVAVMYCALGAGARLTVKTFDAAGGVWREIGKTEMRSTGGLLGMHGGKVYLLKNSIYGSGDQRCFAYTYDPAGGDWTQLADAYADANVVLASLCFPDGAPTILYYSDTGSGSSLCAVQLTDDGWVQLGGSLTGSEVALQTLEESGGRLYASYVVNTANQVYVKSYGLAADHTHRFQEEITRRATCEEPGVRTLTCAVCGKTETQPIPAAGHSWNSTPTVETAPTYSSPGRQSIHCKNCGAVKDTAPIPQKKNPFADVTPGPDSYYYMPVLWALDRDVTRGTDETHFSPFAVCTRGQVVTFLWRAAGSPAPRDGTSPFADVQSPEAYYHQAVLWAVENGITNGTDPTHFSPDATVTRGQFVTFLWRFSGEPAHGGEDPFGDVDPEGFYYHAVLWACERGITNGVAAGSFAPMQFCGRGQTVTFLYRYYA